MQPRPVTPHEEQDARWQAVQTRDARQDGAFVYGVRTTGVYCRPSCPSRQARRDHVTFHAGPREAKAAGLRPCLRCQPDGPPASERQAARVAELCRVLETADEVPTLADLAQRAGLSPFHLQRLFKAVTGVTPKAYAMAVKGQRLRRDLQAKASVTDAALEAGFGSPARFYEQAEGLLGMTPTEYRKGAPGLEIHYAVRTCSLGVVLVAATERGVCALLLGDEAEALRQDLARRFPRARLRDGGPEFEQLLQHAVAVVEQPGLGGQLPLDVQGTAFQLRVWQQLRKVPFGTTVSYTQLASEVGMPRAVRAVARACGANPVAVAIPCHRVVGVDGGFKGYRWGIARKRVLILREGGGPDVARR